MNRSIIIGAFIISAAILVNGFLERSAHVGSTVSALVTPVASPDQTIAVLPFENLSEEKAVAYFAEGIRREIVAQLTAQHVKATNVQEAPRVGELLLGSVQRAGNRVRVSVQLVDATSRVPRGAQTYDRELTDVLAAESEIAENVAKFVATQKP